MIYPLIILVALAVIFIILVRRLPRAGEGALPVSKPTGNDSLPVRKNDAAGASTKKFKLPSFRMPSLPAVKLPSVKLPAIKIPKLPERKAETPAQTAAATSSAASSVGSPSLTKPAKKADDFWVDLEAQAEPLTPSPVVKAAPVAKAEPVSPVPAARPILRPKKRDQFQEAEDAFAIKDYRKAERLYVKMATEDPKNPKIYGRLGVIYLEQKNYEDARDALIMAIKLEPNIPTRHFNLALTYLQIGSTVKAIASMESALKYDPSNRKYRKLLDDIIAGRA